MMKKKRRSSIDENDISVINVSENQSPINQAESTNSVRNPFNSEKISQKHVESTQSQRTSNHLFGWITCIKPSVMATLVFFIFICIATVVSVLIVYFTAPKPSITCVSSYKSLATASFGLDSRPRFVAFGDFNRDNRLDIVVTCPNIDSIGLFFGDVNETFQSEIKYSTGFGSRPYSVAVGDFDNDDHSDIGVANYGTNSVSIFLGNINGTMSIVTTFSTGQSRPLFITVGHFNNDSWLDSIVANYGTNSISVFLGLGNGSFVLKMIYFTGHDSLPNCVAVADLNGDKRLDFVVANYGTNNVGIFFGNGDGTFANQIIYSTGIRSQPYSVTVGDFNQDNHLDIGVANPGNKTIGILYGQNNGSFSMIKKYSIRANLAPFLIAAGNFNEDTYLDIVIVNSHDDSISILLGDRNTPFTTQLFYSTGYGSSPNQLAIDNIDADNRSDIVIPNSGDNNVLVLMGYGVSSIPKRNVISTGSNLGPFSVIVADFNNDIWLDMAVINIYTDSISIYLGFGDGNFGNSITYALGHGSNPRYITTGDFNGDYKLDLAIAHSPNNTISIHLGFGNGSFRNVTEYNTLSPQSLAVSDFNHDHFLDILVANSDSKTISIFFGHGDGTFANQISYSTDEGSFPQWIVVGNWNNNSRLVVFTMSVNSIGVLFVDKNGTFGQVKSYSTDFSSPQSVAVRDLNNDGKLDIIISNSASSSIGIYLANNDSTFQSQKQYSTGDRSFPESLAIGDINNDNRLDVVVSLNKNVGILFGIGDGTFSTVMQYTIWDDYCSGSIAIGDFSSDGHLDVIVANNCTNTLNVNIGYYYASFKNEMIYSTDFSFNPTSIAIADFNSDNRSDMIIGSSKGRYIGIFLGYGNGTFEVEMYSTNSNSPSQFLAVGDFNKDQHLDIVTANYLNDNINVILGNGNGTFGKQLTYSTGLKSAPRSIAITDFDNNSWLDLIVVNQGTNSMSLFLGFNYARFENQKIFSTGNGIYPQLIAMADFNSDNHLDIIVASPDSSSIGLFLGNGNGSFQNVTILPLISLSRPMSVVVGDFNNDHRIDIAIVNGVNFVFESPAAGTVTVLCGNGDGTFKNLTETRIGNNSNPFSIMVGNFNNDHTLDIVIVDVGGTTISIRILFGYGNGTFGNMSTYVTAHSTLPSIAIQDFNNDTQLDIVIINESGITVLLGNGDGSFITINTSTIINSFGVRPIVVGDFNHDNRLDIAFLVTNEFIGVLVGQGNGTFTSKNAYSFDDHSHFSSITVGDLNNDKQLDIVVSSALSNTINIFPGNGDGSFGVIRTYSTGDFSSPQAVILGDFNEDKKTDIAVVNRGNDNFGVFLNDGIEPFVKDRQIPLGNNTRPWAVAIGDFNLDANVDIVVANNGTNNIGIFLGHGDGTFANVIMYSTGINSNPQSIGVGDFNNDAKLDIVVVNYGTNDIGIFLGYGNGSFLNMVVYSTGDRSHPYSVVVNDFDNDKQLDIAVANYGANNILIFHGLGNGTFTKYWSYTSGYESRPYSLAASDLNNDLLMDIIVTNFGKSNIDILLKIC